MKKCDLKECNFYSESEDNNCQIANDVNDCNTYKESFTSKRVDTSVPFSVGLSCLPLTKEV